MPATFPPDVTALLGPSVAARTIYWAPGGTGTGLTSSSPGSLQDAVDEATVAGRILEGVWVLQGVGSGDVPAPDMPDSFRTRGYLKILGSSPGVVVEQWMGWDVTKPGGAGWVLMDFEVPAEPLIYLDATLGPSARGLTLYNGTKVWIENLGTTGFSVTGIDIDRAHGQQIRNHWDRGSVRGLYCKQGSYFLAGGQHIQNSTYGTSELFGATRDSAISETYARSFRFKRADEDDTMWRAVDTSSSSTAKNNALPYGPRVVDPDTFGFHSKEHSNGHMDHRVFIDCPLPISFHSLALANTGNAVISQGDAKQGAMGRLAAAIDADDVTLTLKVDYRDFPSSGELLFADTGERATFSGVASGGTARAVLSSVARGHRSTSAAPHAADVRVTAVTTHVLQGALAADAVIIPLDSVAGMPATGCTEGTVLIESTAGSEQVYFRGTSGTSLIDCTRGAHSKGDALAHPDGALVTLLGRTVQGITVNGNSEIHEGFGIEWNPGRTNAGSNLDIPIPWENARGGIILDDSYDGDRDDERGYTAQEGRGAALTVPPSDFTARVFTGTTDETTVVFSDLLIAKRLAAPGMRFEARAGGRILNSSTAGTGAIRFLWRFGSTYVCESQLATPVTSGKIFSLEMVAWTTAAGGLEQYVESRLLVDGIPISLARARTALPYDEEHRWFLSLILASTANSVQFDRTEFAQT